MLPIFSIGAERIAGRNTDFRRGSAFQENKAVVIARHEAISYGFAIALRLLRASQ